MTSPVLWPNLCKRVTIDLQNNSGDAVEGKGETIRLYTDGALAYPTNGCNTVFGDIGLRTVTATEGKTSVTFWVKSNALGFATVSAWVEYETEDSVLLGDLSFDVVQPMAEVVLGQPDFYSNAANNGGVSASTTNNPRAVETCGDKVIVSDASNNRVLLWNQRPTTNGEPAHVVVGQPDFTTTTSGITQTKFDYPQSASCAVGNTRFVVGDSDNNRYMLYNTFPTTNGAPADIALGAADFTSAGTGGPNAHTFASTTSVTGTSTGFLVTDNSWNRILLFPTFPTANNSDATIVLGNPDFTTTGDGVSPSLTNTPYGARQRGDYILVADCNNNRVLIWPAAGITSGANASVVVGQSDFLTNSPPSTVNATTFGCPTSVDWDGDHLAVFDTAANRILIWNGMPTTNGVAADLAIGPTDLVTAGFTGPSPYSIDTGSGGLAMGEGNGLWVAESNNNRIVRFPAP